MTDRLALLFATSGHSGVDRVVGNLLPELGRVPRRFDLLLVRGHGPYPGTLPGNVTLRRLPAAHKDTVLPALAWYLRRHRPAALLTASHKLNRAALLARRLSRVDLRVVIRMGMSVTAMGDDLPPRRRDALYASMRRWYPLADAAVTPSRGVGEDLLRIAGVAEDRLHVIPNPIVNPRLHELAEAPLEHPWYGDPDCPVILGAGSLEPRKDFATLVRAFARVRGQRPCRLVILGEGRQRERLRALARELGVGDDLDLPGYEGNPYRHMRRAGVFVLSSRREGASAVIVEALACGTPVVSTDCPSGPAETLQQGRYGRLVPIGDEAAMADAIAGTLAEPPPPERLREATREHCTATAAARYLAAMGVESTTADNAIQP